MPDAHLALIHCSVSFAKPFVARERMENAERACYHVQINLQGSIRRHTMKNKVFLMLTLSILVLPLNSHSDFPPRTIFPKDVPGEYPEPVEIHIDGAVDYIQYSPNGKLLAVVTYPGSGLHLYNTQTLEKVHHIKPPEGFLKEVVGLYSKCIAFSPDGKILVSGNESRNGKGNINLWDVATGTHKQMLTAHSEGVYSVAFSPDGKILAGGGVERFFVSDGEQLTKLTIGTIYLWNANTGHFLRHLTVHELGVVGVAFSPDGKTLASGNWDNTIRLWDVATGTHKQTLTANHSGMLGVSFSLDGKLLVSWGQWGGIFLWDASTGSLLHRLTRATSDTDGLSGIALSPDGKTLASASGEGVRLWDVNTGSYLHSMRESMNIDTRSVAFSPDGRTLASGSRSGTVFLWDVLPILLPEDINKDGIVNIQDLVIVAQAFGEAEPDLNGDGVVNIQDLVIVASAFGNTVADP